VKADQEDTAMLPWFVLPNIREVEVGRDEKALVLLGG
jgi:hypothetical protein